MKYFSEKMLVQDTPNINQKRCINFYSRKEQCSICKDNCFAVAIDIKKNRVDVDDKTCNGCGVCRALCPSQAIELNKNYDIKAIRKAKENEIVVVGCNEEGNEGNVNFSCLNSLHIEYLAAFILVLGEKKVYFNLSKCNRCYMKYGCKLFENTLEKTIVFINNLGIKPNIELVLDKQCLPKYSEHLISRRDLFTLFKRQSTDIVSDIVDDAMIKDNTYNARDTILEHIDNLIYSNENSLEINKNESIFTNWQVNDNCNGCGVCQSMCSSKAWKVEKQKCRTIVSHNARYCKSCGLCSDICPEKSLFKANFLTSLLTGFVRKKEIALGLCKQCSSLYNVKKDDDGYCCICKKRMTIRKSILLRT